MIEFTITKIKNYGIIAPLPTGKLAAALSRNLSYEKKGIEFMPNRAWGIVKLYSVKRGLFAWGLLARVINIFDQYNDKVESISYNIDSSVMGTSMIAESFILRPYQIEAVNALIRNNGGILSVPTGGGKTIIATEYLKHMARDALVIVTTLDIKHQWEKQLVDYPFIKVINYQNKVCPALVKNSEIIIFDECHHAPCKSLYRLAMSANTNTILVGLSATI